MTCRFEGAWEMAVDLPPQYKYESVSLGNYRLSEGQAVEVGGYGYVAGTVKVRPSPSHIWREVPEDNVRPVEQADLGLSDG